MPAAMPPPNEDKPKTSRNSVNGNELGHNEIRQLAELRVNPVLDALNNAFTEFIRVVEARPSLTTATIVEQIRQELIGLITVVTMQMNTGNVNGLLNHLLDAQHLTQNIVVVTGKVRAENGASGFHVLN